VLPKFVFDSHLLLLAVNSAPIGGVHADLGLES
jgi:hypothetical protein